MPEAAELLATWEAGVGLGGQGDGQARRAQLLHALTRPHAEVAELLDVPLGERDTELYALRRRLFGERLDVRVGCPGCHEEMEFALDVATLVGTGGTRPQRQPLRVESGQWVVRLRLPTPGDLLAIVSKAGSEAGGAAGDEAGGSEPSGPAGGVRQVLLQRCVLEATRAGEPVGVAELPESVLERVSAAAEEADPHADVRMAAPCPECGHRLSVELDIASYLWDELDSWARSTLLDVHLLACAYGWTEPDVLALSPLRRRYYLELAGYA